MGTNDFQREYKRLERYISRISQQGVQLPESDHIALLLNGLGSSSHDLSLAALTQAVKPTYDPALFSYRKVGEPYTPADIQKTPDEVSRLIDAHFDSTQATNVCLLGYSLGGIGLAYWLTRNGLKHLSRIDRIVFVATPVWIIAPSESTFPTLGRLLHEYSFDWPAFESLVLPRVECLVLRCEVGADRLFKYGERWMSFEAREISLEDLDLQEHSIPDVDHFNICPNQVTAKVLGAWIHGDEAAARELS